MPDDIGESSGSPWSVALCAIAVFAASRHDLGGIHVRARAGPVREAFLSMLRAVLSPDTPWLRASAATPIEGFLGGVDLGASLGLGRPVVAKGVLARADGGVLELAMAERIGSSQAALIASALDNGTMRGVCEKQNGRFSLVALDEGADEDECLPHILADRLALFVDLEQVAWGETRQPLRPARLEIPVDDVAVADSTLADLCAIAQAVGGSSLRKAIFLVRVARCLAALEGRGDVVSHHVADATQLVFGPIGIPDDALEETTTADGPDRHQEEARRKEDTDADQRTDRPEPSAREQDDIAVRTATAILPEGIALSRSNGGMLRNRQGDGSRGRSADKPGRRGRPAGLRERPPHGEARLNVSATLRAAAPWQKLRATGSGGTHGSLLRIRKSDFRYTFFRTPAEPTAIFAVDASGSTALDRLGEAKGAVELLLSDCYVQRAHVAVIAFRGSSGEVLLAPTRSLVRAKRSLAALPGGGGTPLASGMAQALLMAESARRAGQSPVVVLLTDGSGNVALDGRPDRQAARQDCETVAGKYARAGIRCVLIDIARGRKTAAKSLAEAMRADYCRLPVADAAAVSDVVAGYVRSA